MWLHLHSYPWRWLQENKGPLSYAFMRHAQLQPLSDAERSRLLGYRYVAPALSLIERCGLDDFWALVAERVYPRWLAPNLITLGGGACIGLATALTLACSPLLSGAAPAWVYAANAALILCYQTLDGSDGKQARRTTSGSPLGELVDHGVDAWATGCIVFICLDAFAFGIASPWPWLILVGAQAAFFASNLTLLHAGRMKVDDFGVIELQSVMCACLGATAVCSPSLWAAQAPRLLGGYEVRQILGAGILGAMVKAVAEAVGEVLRDGDGGGGGGGVHSASPRRAAWRQCGLVAVYVGFVGLSFGCVRRQRDGGMALRLLWCCANSAFAELLSRLLVLRVTSRPLPTVVPSLLALAGFAAAAALMALGAGRGAGGLGACALAAGTAAIAHLAYFAWAGRATAGALGVHPFRVRGARSWWRL